MTFWYEQTCGFFLGGGGWSSFYTFSPILLKKKEITLAIYMQPKKGAMKNNHEKVSTSKIKIILKMRKRIERAPP